MTKTLAEPLLFLAAAALSATTFVAIGRSVPPAQPTVGVENAVSRATVQRDVNDVPIAVIESFFRDEKRRSQLAADLCAEFGRGSLERHSAHTNTLEVKCARASFTVVASAATASPNEHSSISFTMERPTTQSFTISDGADLWIEAALRRAGRRSTLDSGPPYRCPEDARAAMHHLQELIEMDLAEDHPAYISTLTCIQRHKPEPEPTCGTGEEKNLSQEEIKRINNFFVEMVKRKKVQKVKTAKQTKIRTHSASYTFNTTSF